MKNLSIVIAIISLLAFSCKTRDQTPTTTQVQIQTVDVWTGPTNKVPKTQGKVSHEYKATGCNTVLVVKTADNANPMVLIPISPLPAEFDKDGIDLYFNYRLSRMKNPEGCVKGIPAEVTDISLK
jgi:hypothetical protein